MSKNGFIVHPKEDRCIIRRKVYLELVDLVQATKTIKDCAAELLTAFEWWTVEEMSTNNELEDFWIAKSEVELKEWLLDSYTEKTIREGNRILASRGFVTVQKPGTSRDRTFKYRFERERVQAAIFRLYKPEDFETEGVIAGLEHSSTSFTEEFVYPTAKPKGIGWVYVLHAVGTSRYKIGLTTTVDNSRIEGLKLSSPVELKLVKKLKCKNVKAVEEALHFHFRFKRLHREWFDLSQEDVNWIKQASEQQMLAVGDKKL